MELSIAVLGLGNWGTALSNHLATKGFPVLGWAIEQDIVAEINSKHRNPRFLSHVTLDAKLSATSDLSKVLQADLIVLSLPSSALSQVVPKLHFRKEAILVSAVKGLEPSSLLTPLQFCEQRLAVCCNLAVLSGPSFAKDVVVQRPCGVVAASSSEAVARRVAEVFTGNSMKVYISTDPLGVEIGGIVKNVIALAVGVCDGLGLGESARAGLITRGLAEMMRLAEAMGADVKTLAGLSGLGDLAMTATSDASRNHTVGVRLGKGEELSDILASLGSVAEGVTATPLVLKLANKFGIEMPISEHAAKLIAGQMTAQETVKSLLGRPMRKEFE